MTLVLHPGIEPGLPEGNGFTIRLLSIKNTKARWRGGLGLTQLLPEGTDPHTVRLEGIEPSLSVWKTEVIPIYDKRNELPRRVELRSLVYKTSASPTKLRKQRTFQPLNVQTVWGWLSGTRTYNLSVNSGMLCRLSY